ncbi:hypothetical protein [Burkholderia pyrrocinia]|uniref:hypothetical protein n=1 Tax=Burkholderia pyrrocinia TaxID=60550 RepID=UPI0012601A2B|nr:hypothetical protein [Burkholderia pyrrocinia]
MKTQLFLRFAQYRVFWSARRTIGRIAFLFTSRLYKANQSLKDARTNSLSLVGIGRVTAAPWFRAIVVASILQLSNPWLCRLFGKLGYSVPNDSDYVTFLAAISSIGGVFIGLYYAAIATVGSAMYAKVPGNLRDLLAQDRFGNVYMQFLSFLTYLCLVLICLRLSNLDRIYIAPPLVTLAAGVGVFAFVRLGQRVFHLFDPAELSSHIFEQLHRSMSSVTVGRLKWQDKSFQHHAYKRAEKSVTVLETLRDLLLQEAHLSGAPLLEVSLRTTRFLMFYRTKRAWIPTNSLWYQQIYRHAEWYRTDDMRLSVATETGTSVSPKTEVNHEWLEERLIAVLLDCLAVNVRNAQWENAIAALQHIEHYTTLLAKLGRGDFAFTVFQQACSRTTDAIKQSSNAVQAETVQKVAVAEALASLPIAISLALRERYASFRRADVVARIEGINWSNPTTYYQAGFEDYVLSQIEYLAPRLEFEQAVEGKKISPSWYLGELALQPQAKHFVKNIAVLMDDLPEAYAMLRETFSAVDLHWMTAATLSRQWEYWHKLAEQVAVWQGAWSEMSDNRKLTELPWAKFDIDSTRVKLGPMKSALLKAMSNLQTRLSPLERPPTYPDYAGQFLHLSGEALLQALLDGDTELLRDVFDRYFVGCLAEFGKLQSSEGPDWLVKQNLRIAAAPVLDLMDVSGYALLLSELHGNRALWSIVRSTWDRYFAEPQRLAGIVALVNFVESGLGATSRDILRTRWQRLVEDKLEQLPRKPVEDKSWYMTNQTEAVHPSSLVRAMASRTSSLNYEGTDIFIGLYVARNPGAKNLQEHWQRSELSDELAGEEYNVDTSDDEGQTK